MPSFLQGFLQAEFLPHGWCYRWDSGVVWLHVVSDLLIALAYYVIPFSLVYIVRRRGDLVYPWMFWLFGAFILACGTTHLMNVFVVWYPWYRLDGVIKLFTGIVSIATAILMIRVAPAVVALPSHEEVRRMNRQLEKEVAERKAAEQEVRTLNAELERRVEERTQELHRLNQQLRESERRTRAILDSSPALVYLKDMDGKLLFVNRQFEDLTGRTREELIGKTDFEIFPDDLADAYRRVDAGVAESGKAVQAEEIAVADGEPRTYMSVKFPLEDEAGQLYAICGISTDITERKKSEQELRRYNAELEQFAHVVSHDLQEPLRTVKSYAQLLSRRYRNSLDSDADDFIGFITGGVDRMQDLISGLQIYSELNRPIRTENDSSDAGAVLADTVRHMEATVREHDARVTWDGLPPVRIPPAQLGQLFQNLISNAVKYRKPDQPPEIRVEATRNGHEWEFVVADNGIGIEMRYAEQIFGVFRRLHGREVPGTGIGLAICKKVVESAGGRIWVESELGVGSQFHFTVPPA